MRSTAKRIPVPSAGRPGSSWTGRTTILILRWSGGCRSRHRPVEAVEVEGAAAEEAGVEVATGRAPFLRSDAAWEALSDHERGGRDKPGHDPSRRAVAIFPQSLIGPSGKFSRTCQKASGHWDTADSLSHLELFAF